MKLSVENEKKAEIAPLVKKLAAKAVKEDGWMIPCPEENAEKCDNEEALLEAHRDGWEETGHFDVFYRKEILRLMASHDLFMGDNEDGETGLITSEDEEIEILMELIDIFWEEWEFGWGMQDRLSEALKGK